MLHARLQMDYPPVVVSPLWVEESIKAGRRLVERKFLVRQPGRGCSFSTVQCAAPCTQPCCAQP
jgi:hypothetical protein